MEKFKILRIAVMVFFSLAIASCSNKSNQSQVPIVSAEVILEYIVNTFSSSGGGIYSHLDSAATYAAQSYKLDTMYNHSFGMSRSDSSAGIHYSYAINYQYGKTTTPSVQFYFNYTASGTCDTPDLSITEEVSANYIITGLEPTAQNFILQGSGQEDGTEKAKQYGQKFNINLAYNINAQLTKTDHGVDAGLAYLTLTGSNPDGQSFSYSALVQFLGNGQGVVVLNGTSHPFNLLTGKIG